MANHIQTTVAKPKEEYQALCKLLFNKSGAACNAMDQATRSRLPAAADQGLLAYFQGIVSGTTGYSYFDAERRFAPQLNLLQGKDVYLIGTGTCSVSGDDRRCFTVSSSRRPANFDFVDDMYNLVGAFEFLRTQVIAKALLNTCFMSAATFGAKGEASQFCGFFYSHNLLMTPYTLTVRFVPEYYKSHHLGKPQIPMSSCQ